MLCSLSIVLNFALGILECPENTVYFKITKRSGSYAEEESVAIYGDSKLYETPIFEDSTTVSYESCLNQTTNSQYTIRLFDSASDSWEYLSWVAIEGPYGNIVFKNNMIDDVEEVYPLSLYSPITTNQDWKFYQGDMASNWNEYDFDDSTWTILPYEAVIPLENSTQFYRFSFTGLPSIAAYEVRFNYRLGVIAYLNGREIYRDNLPSGDITGSTLATGSYEVYQYRGVIRNGIEAEGECVLSVSIHHTSDSVESNRTFDAWLAEYMSNSNNSCYTVPYSVSLSSSLLNTGNIFDWDISSRVYLPFFFPFTFKYHYSGDVIPVINGVRIFPYSHYSQAPREYRLSGGTSDSSYTSLFYEEDVTYNFFEYQTRTTDIIGGLWRYYKIEIYSASGGIGYVYEMQPCVCHVRAIDSIVYDPGYYSYFANYESVLIKPVDDITDCEIKPSLPSGLSFDQASCTLSGIAQTTLPNTTFTVTSSMNGGISGTFSLAFTSCDSTLLEVYRTYTSTASQEAFTIRDPVGTVLYNVPINNKHLDNEVVSSLLCTSVPYITIDTDGNTQWSSNSFLYIRAVLDASLREILLRARFDSILGLPQPYTLSLNFPVQPRSTWFYKMGEVPTSWDDAQTAGWETGSATQFPDSTNRLQIYKRSFTVASLADVTFFTLNVKYRYGIIVSINSKEAFRYGVDGTLSADSTATTSYQDDSFHLVSLSARSVLVEGTNHIAIALVSIAVTQVTSIFDCSLRLIHANERSRVWDFSADGSGVYGDVEDVFNQYNGNVLRSLLFDGRVSITFANNRRETINQVMITNCISENNYNVESFQFQAKNPEDSDWTTLRTVSDLSWSFAAQKKTIWIVNSKPYNMYQFNDISGYGLAWRITMLDLLSVNVPAVIPQLEYPAVTIYRDVEMAEVYPTSEYYMDFSVDPSLPEGISLDPMTGMISGTTSATYSGTHQIKATSVMGVETNYTLQFVVGLCTGGKSLITFTVRTDYNPDRGSFTLFKGRPEDESVISQVDEFSVASSLMYFDYCLDDSIYTLRITDSTGSGWASPAGVMLSVDIGTFRFGVEMMGEETAASSKLLRFSSYLPFQNEFTEWKIWRIARDDLWMNPGFDDSDWQHVKAGEIGVNVGATVYLRQLFSLPSLDDYQVLNVMVKFRGGLLAYVNGHRVARFNLPESVTSETESLEEHDDTKSVFFHVILPTVSPMSDNNVFAVELHRVKGTSSSDPVTFYATAVFGVDDCSIVRDTLIPGNYSTLDYGTIDDFLDLSPLTYTRFQNEGKPFFDWAAENLEGSRFNYYGFITTNDATDWGFTLYGQLLDQAPAILHEVTGAVVKSRTRLLYEAPVGLGGYNEFNWQIDTLPSAPLNIVEMLFLYCKASGDVCQGIEGFPTVSEGQISPSSCSEGFSGYSYRICQNGTFSDIYTDHCIYKKPANVIYSTSNLVFIKDIFSASEAPTVENIVTRWYVAEGQKLPEGLTVNNETGVISGIPREKMTLTSFRIYGSNPSGIASTEVMISVRAAVCQADGPWPAAEVGEVLVYDCSLQGDYVGQQKRACLLGETDGVWGKATGMCVSILMVVVLVVVGIIILAVLVILIVRISKRKKAVGGLKGAKKPGAKKVSTPRTPRTPRTPKSPKSPKSPRV